MSEKTITKSQEISIDVPSILEDIKRNLVAILLCALAMTMLGYTVSKITYKPQFSASEILVVSSDRSDIAVGSKSQDELTSLFANLLKGDILKRKVQEDIGSIDYSLSTRYEGDTNIMTLTVTSNSPQNAIKAMQSVVNRSSLLTDQLLSDVQLIILQAPSLSGIPVNPINYKVLMLFSFVLGGALCTGVVALFSILRDTVKNENDARTKVDATLLGVLPIAPKLVDEPRRDYFLLSNLSLPLQYTESYYLAVSRIMARMDRRNAKVLMVTSVTPNEGKTTAVVNLALALEKNQKKVLVIDADFRNPSIANTIGADGAEHQLTDVLKSGRISEVELTQVPNSSVDYIMNRKAAAHAGEYFGNGTFKRLLDRAKVAYDYILVDTGPVALVSDTEAIASLCDASLLVVDQDTALVPAINDAIDMLNRSEGSFIGMLFKMRLRRKSGAGYGYGYGYGYDNKKASEA